jgi:hypothetical protein
MSVGANVGADQLNLIGRARSFLDGRRQRGIDISLDPECYLNSWARVPGNATLRRLAFGWRAEPARLAAKARDVASALRTRGLSITGSGGGANAFDQMIVSWALPGDFDAQGSYTDRYFGLRSCETPRVLWFLMLLSGSAPVELPENVRVTYPSTAAAGRAISGNRLSGTVLRAEAIAAAVQEELNRGTVRQVLMPYEAQPFQHAINIAVKAQNPHITTVGYVHSMLPALPTDFLLRPGAPDRLLVHGVGQAEILVRHLGWPAEQLEVIASLRYLRGPASALAGQILLPYSFGDSDSIARALEAVMRRAPRSSMPQWKVRNHPVMAGSAAHAALEQRLRTILERFADRMSPDERVSKQTVIIGATSSVIEALERGLDVVHICVNPLFETHSQAIWTHLDVEDIGDNAYRYRLQELGSYIVLGDTREAAKEILEIGA